MAGQLDDFCHMIRAAYGGPCGISPGDLAKHFVSQSGLSSYPSFMELHSVLRRYGVSEITAADLSAGRLKGHHFSYRGSGYIVAYERNLWLGSIEHVMLHELYEIIAERYQRLYPDYQRPPVPEICVPANRFAAAALMQREVFLEALFETGFDIVQLHHRFYKAYSSVGIRAIEVLNERNEELPAEERIDLMVMIYERMEEEDPREWGFCTPDKFQIRYSPRTRGVKLGTRGGIWLPGGRLRGPNYRAPRYPWHLIPKRGDGVAPDSLALKVVNAQGCLFLRKVTGFDLWGLNDLTFIAQPVRWYGKLAKVVLVGVRSKDNQILQPHLDRLRPIVIDESYQLI